MKRKHSARLKQLSVRGVTSQLSARLDAIREKRHQSLNQTVLELLSEAVGLEPKPWTDRYTRMDPRQAKDLERTLEEMRRVNPGDWA